MRLPRKTAAAATVSCERSLWARHRRAHKGVPMFRTSVPEIPEGTPWGVIGGAIGFVLMLVIGYLVVS